MNKYGIDEKTYNKILQEGRMSYFKGQWWKYWPYNMAVKVLEGEDMLDRFIPTEFIHTLSETATERELRIAYAYFCDGFTYEAVGRMEGVGKERIRQIVQKVIRKMRHPSRAKRYLAAPYDKIDSLGNLLAAYKSKFGVISTSETNPNILGDLNLSVRPYNCLSRANKTRVKDFDCMKVTDLMHIRNFGRMSIVETVLKLVEYGFDLRQIGTDEYWFIDTSALYEPEDFYNYYFSWPRKEN